jgi:hypothetical protein
MYLLHTLKWHKKTIKRVGMFCMSCRTWIRIENSEENGIRTKKNVLDLLHWNNKNRRQQHAKNTKLGLHTPHSDPDLENNLSIRPDPKHEITSLQTEVKAGAEYPYSTNCNRICCPISGVITK